MAALDRFIDWVTPEARRELLGTRGRLAVLAVGIGLAVLAPLVESSNPFWIILVTEILIFALFALSFDFAFGHSGLPSFGHAAMFGAAGYATAFLMLSVTQNLLVVLSVSAVVGFLLATVIAWLSVRTNDIYFAFLTLAFAQMVYLIAIDDIPAVVLGADSITAGDNGLVALPTYELFGVSFAPLLNYYYLTLLLVAVAFVVLLRVANSPFGRVMASIRENEERVGFLGYDVRRYKIVAFALSGAFAGLAGSLFVTFQSIVHPSMLFWTTSGEVFLMTLLGGAGTLWGPMVGASLVIFIEDSFSTNWKIVLGAVYIVVVIFAPQGLASLLGSLEADPKAAGRSIKQSLLNYVRKVRG